MLSSDYQFRNRIPFPAPNWIDAGRCRHGKIAQGEFCRDGISELTVDLRPQRFPDLDGYWSGELYIIWFDGDGRPLSLHEFTMLVLPSQTCQVRSTRYWIISGYCAGSGSPVLK